MANGKIRYKNCSIIDLHDRIAVCSVNLQYINADLAIKALAKALENEHPEKRLILHSDQSVQFPSCHLIEQNVTKILGQYSLSNGEKYMVLVFECGLAL